MAKLRALVADDDADMLSVVSKALVQFGADVVAATSGGALLEKIANDGDFDVIVTDISMPWMTGLQVMHSARAAGLRVPIIVMTALRDPTIPEQVASLGVRAELLHKPFSIDELHAALRHCLADAGDETQTLRAHAKP
ncbi:MAG TPA: response regulator [Kofleriaceae bacterium]|jgi:two-component system response regulator TctD|nr:response regulator [Kofleriaceae bacterium]